jgi:hypothetical protein
MMCLYLKYARAQRSALDEENKKIKKNNGKLSELSKEFEGIKEEQRKILESMEKLQTKKELV